MTPSRIDLVDVQIIELIARGMTSRRIGVRLGYSTQTIKNRLGPVMQRLEVASRAALVARAHALGIIDVSRLWTDQEGQTL